MTVLRLGLPWYVHPAEDEAAWASLAERRPRPSFVVVNVSNGPGAPDDEWYPDAVTRLRGLRVLGYVDVRYGERSPREVQDEVGAWLSRYRVDGVMLDRYPSDSRSVDRCIRYVSAARSSGAGFIVGNPGTMPDLAHLALLDVACVFEGSAASYAEFRPPAALASVPADRVWHLIHSCPPERLSAVAERAARLGAGHAFGTDRVLPHPWGGFPLQERMVDVVP